jgi:hypothetical protein
VLVPLPRGLSLLPGRSGLISLTVVF